MADFSIETMEVRRQRGTFKKITANLEFSTRQNGFQESRWNKSLFRQMKPELTTTKPLLLPLQDAFI